MSRRRRAGPWRRFFRRSQLFRRAETQWRYLRSRHAIWRWVLLGGGGLILLGFVWIVVTGLVARHDAMALRSRLSQVQRLVAAGDIANAEKVAGGLQGLSDQAHKLTTGPAWFIASEIPYFGKPVQIVRGTTAAADELGDNGVTALVDVISKLDPAKLRTRGDTINLAPVIAAAPRLKVLDSAIDKALAKLASSPHSSWLSPVNDVRDRMVTTLNSVGGYVDAATRAAQVLPPMLGEDGPKRYFIGLQNEAEMRGTGGLPGAFAILVANKGTVKFTHFESDIALQPGTTHFVTTGLNFGAGYNSAYGASQPTNLYVNSNISPNFPYAAQVWAAMWEKVSGEHVDGALGMDPQVLSNLLAVTGPAKATGGGVLTAASVVPLTEQQEYAIFSDNTERKDFLVAVLKTVSTEVISGKAPAISLVRAFGESAKEHRLLVWVRDKTAQQAIEETNYSGAIPTATNRTFVGLVVNNAAAGKLDYYLRRSVDYQSTGCGETRDVNVTITLTNDAPASGLPAYVTTRLDPDHPSDVKPGDNREIVDYYATAGAQLSGLTIDGQPATAAVENDLNHPIFRLDMELPQGKTSTIVLHLAEPRTTGSVQVWQQPGVVPLTANVEKQAC